MSMQKWMADAGHARDWCGCCGVLWKWKGPGGWASAVIPPQGALFMEFTFSSLGNGEIKRGIKHATLIAIFLETEEHPYVFNYCIDPGSVDLMWKI